MSVNIRLLDNSYFYITKADIGINPQNDGTGVRLIFPELNEARRKAHAIETQMVEVEMANADDGENIELNKVTSDLKFVFLVAFINKMYYFYANFRLEGCF